jgi:hypothetical protein
MASAPLSTGIDQHHGLRAAVQRLGFGFAWGAGMLVLLALWLHAKYPPEQPRFYPILVAAAAALSAGLAIRFLALGGKSDESALKAMLHQGKLALLGGGFLLVALGFLLGFVKTGANQGVAAFLDNFGEAVGLILFGLIAMGAGLAATGASSDEHHPLLDMVGRNLALVRFALAVACVACLGVFVYLAFSQRIGADWLPELGALMMLGVLFLTCMLAFTLSNEADASSLRVFILVLGGAVGFILFTMITLRAWFWRDQLFLGGMSAWQGENAWKLWLCIYVQIVALILIFGSLSAARGDVRNNVNVRRVLFGYDTALSTLLLLEILIVLNILTYSLVPYNFDWTKGRGLHALSPSTKNLLASLKQPTTAFVLLPQTNPAYRDLKNLLDNCQGASAKLKVEYINPDTDLLKYNNIARFFPAVLPSGKAVRAEGAGGRGLLLVYGEMPIDEKQKVPHTFISDRKIVAEEGDPDPRRGAPRKLLFKGEVELYRELSFLARDQKKQRVYFLQDDDELDIANMRREGRRDFRIEMSKLGGGMLVDKLKKENYDVSGLSFEEPLPNVKRENTVFAKATDKKKDVPEDAYAVVIAGASKQLSSDALEALDRFMQRGGRMLVFADNVVDRKQQGLVVTGVEGMLRKYGVDLTSEFVLIPPTRAGNSPFDLFALAADSDNLLAKQFANEAIQFSSPPRVVKGIDNPVGYKVESILVAVNELKVPFLVEKSVTALQDPLGHFQELDRQKSLMAKLSRENPSVAVAVTDSQTDRPRMVVIGDCEFIDNLELPRESSHFALAISALEWLAGRDGAVGVGPRPKETTTYSVSPATPFGAMIFLPFWLMLLAVVGLGVGIWITRRR